MTGTPDYIGPDDTPRSEDKIQRVHKLAFILGEKSQAVTGLEIMLEELKGEILELTSRTLPNAMDDAGVDRIGVPELDIDIKIEPWTKALLPKSPEQRAAAVNWLVEHGHADLLKTEVSAIFTRGEHNEALDAAAALQEKFPEKQVVVSEDIHHMTYGAFAREQLGKGNALPVDVLGITMGRVAKVKERGEKSRG